MESLTHALPATRISRRLGQPKRYVAGLSAPRGGFSDYFDYRRHSSFSVERSPRTLPLPSTGCPSTRVKPTLLSRRFAAATLQPENYPHAHAAFAAAMPSYSSCDWAGNKTHSV